MKNFLTTLVFAFFALSLIAQNDEEKVVIKKEKKVVVENAHTDEDKVISIDVQKEGDAERKIKIKISDNGDGEVIKWTDSGEIPDEILKKLEEKGIDIQELERGEKMMLIEGDDDDEIEIEKTHKIVIKMDDGNETMEVEWDGEGEMPEEMQELLEEHEIDIHEMHDKGKKKKIRMKMHKKGGDWTHDPHMKKRMHGGDHIWVEKYDRGMHRRGRLGDAYMGAQIETADGGVRIVDVMVDSPAHKAGLKKGDIVTEVNGANTKSMEDLLTLLSFFDPDDTIELQYKREDKEKSTKVTLAKRPDSYK